jgi:hypothetical protein
MPISNVTTSLLFMAGLLTIAVICLVPLREIFPRTTASVALLWFGSLSLWLLAHTVTLATDGRAIAINLSRHFVNISTFSYRDRPGLFLASLSFYILVSLTLLIVSSRRLMPIARGRGVWP